MPEFASFAFIPSHESLLYNFAVVIRSNLLACVVAVLLLSACGQVKGPRGLRQSEWVAWCTSNPASTTCLQWNTLSDSIYISGLQFEQNSLRIYHVDSSISFPAFRWTEVVPAAHELIIDRDSIFIQGPDLNTTLMYYSLEDEVFTTLEPINSEVPLEAGLQFSLVDGVPDNHPSIPEF